VQEVLMILKQRQVLVDGRARTDTTFPTGFMDVISIPKTQENFRLVFDSKGRFIPLPIDAEEAKVCCSSLFTFSHATASLSLPTCHPPCWHGASRRTRPPLLPPLLPRTRVLLVAHLGAFWLTCCVLCNTQYKIGKVKQCRLGPGGIPFAVLHDGKTIRYPDPNTKVGDTVKVRRVAAL
jgi:ribosomal protein S4E